MNCILTSTEIFCLSLSSGKYYPRDGSTKPNEGMTWSPRLSLSTSLIIQPTNCLCKTQWIRAYEFRLIYLNCFNRANFYRNFHVKSMHEAFISVVKWTQSVHFTAGYRKHCTEHCTLHTAHCTPKKTLLCTLQNTLHTSHCTLHCTLNWLHYTENSALCAELSSALQTAHSTSLHNVLNCREGGNQSY